MPEEVQTEEPKATGKFAEVTFRSYEGGKVFCICAMPGEGLDSKTFDLTGTSFVAVLNEVTMLALALGMAPQVDA